MIAYVSVTSALFVLLALHSLKQGGSAEPAVGVLCAGLGLWGLATLLW